MDLNAASCTVQDSEYEITLQNLKKLSVIVEMAKGVAVLNNLQDGDKMLISKACTHHGCRKNKTSEVD
ncbi:hypothetical protein AGMMS49573_02560 [Endomicrobiia bacterium]|nr:hypothetical protein AGMMS49523_06370 [Endomicrobiia bacterium]GHT08668.1 hypothetical protein AGMMS49532_04330 [Endomicrobiia bacterium]GHT11818.1 hypothetical protein AGMMS49571_02760 [Endomicrobiia bacterium]GHT15619.1 hypothetical protein AGMMS49573_02560 [Endomicrobiia bacterium]GHT19758.1 hypothetical protein AGMMS49929_04260 [Endomicrobiia bacterium]